MGPDVGQYEVVDAPGQERFEIWAERDTIGFTTYKRRGRLIAFIHTEVEPEYEGEGVASQLISGALDAAREQGLAVLPFCPFVRGYIAKHPDEYLDLVPKDLREHFELAA
ncbi:MAG: GNAT family N-acetyltransferase [Solirubrobacterales bacterium]